MTKQEAVNTFTDGLALDLNPLTMPNTALTNALNATLLTNNGNEMMLLNDMGNCRVETAMLPTGYIPLGSTSFGGIIYIVSYNPIDKKYQIGSFPSPERNLSKDELKDNTKCVINLDEFCEERVLEDGTIVKWNTVGDNFGDPNNIIINYYLKKNLLKDSIYPGDKYKVYSSDLKNYTDFLSAYFKNNTNINSYPKYLKIDIVSTLDNGKVISLTDNSVWNEVSENPYYIYLGDIELNNEGNIGLDEYRSLIGSNYDTYQSKLSGKLGIVARLEVPTSFLVDYVVLTNTSNNKINYDFYFYLNWSNDHIDDNFKNKINPIGIECLILNKFIYKLSITLLEYNDTENNINGYCSIEIPIDNNGLNYNNDDFDIISYLTSEKNNFINKLRKNDGSDFQYVIKGPRIIKLDNQYFYETTSNEISILDNILNLDIIPCMPFGKLDFLKTRLSINLKNINQNIFNLYNYQYYVDDDEINFDFFIEAYPLYNKHITGGTITFYNFLDVIKDSKWLELDIYTKESIEKQLSLSVNDSIFYLDIPSPYTGKLHISKNRHEDNLDLNKDCIYLAEFHLEYSEKDIYFYRLFFNNTIFNNAYGLGEDFKDLYLYDSNLNYGIKPTLELTDNNYPNTPTLIEGSSLPEYTFTLNKEYTTTHIYNIKHNIDSNINLNSGLQDLILNVNNFENNLIKASIDINSSDERIKTNNKSEITVVFDENTKKIRFSNNFNVEIPYVIDYSKPETIPVYNLVPLTNNLTSENKSYIRMLHYSGEADLGRFSLMINSENAKYKEKDIQSEFFTPNEGKGLLYDLDIMTNKLLDLMDKNEYDYITLLFGILYMGDTNAGYGVYCSSGKNRYMFIRRPFNNFIKINCIRTNSDDVVLVHDYLYLPQNLGADNFDDDKNPEMFDDLMPSYNASNSKDATIIEGNYNKYKKSNSNSKTLYYVNDIDCPTNITINTNYSFDVNIDSYQLILHEENITTTSVKNLSFKDSLKFNVLISLKDNIDNNDIINAIPVNNYNIVGINIKNELLTQEDIDSVFNNGVKDSNFSINRDGYMTISSDSFKKYSPTTWYFAWEDVKHNGKEPQVISYDDLIKDTHQYYVLNYTYSK